MKLQAKALAGFISLFTLCENVLAQSPLTAGIVATERDCLVLRQEASYKSGRITCIRPGTPLKFKPGNGKYLWVQTPSGQQGYVFHKYLKQANSTKPINSTNHSASFQGGGLSRKDCRTNVSSTVYFMPVEGNVPSQRLKKNTINFRQHVKLQGSGVLANGNRIDYRGKITRPPKNCTTTVTSAAQVCLLAYFSIAADLKKGFRLGDIVYIPSMKGKKIRLPDSGKVIEHPGLFIVHDVGGAIKGQHRMDFFTGKDNPLTAENQFHKLGLADKYRCDRSYSRISKKDPRYAAAYRLIYSLTDSTKTKFNTPAPADASQAVASK